MSERTIRAAHYAYGNEDQVVHLRVSWEAYAALVAGLDEAIKARLTYDGETLEIMSDSHSSDWRMSRGDEVNELAGPLFAGRRVRACVNGQ